MVCSRFFNHLVQGLCNRKLRGGLLVHGTLDAVTELIEKDSGTKDLGFRDRNGGFAF